MEAIAKRKGGELRTEGRSDAKHMRIATPENKSAMDIEHGSPPQAKAQD